MSNKPCPRCDGTGKVDLDQVCPVCHGQGTIED